MTGLATCLWKEWRDQRVEVVGYALLVPILMAIAIVAIPGAWARADAMPTFVAVGGFLIGALTIASDLVPGEVRRGRIEFLARLPCDLRVPFVAKLVFAASALAGFCLYAWFWATTLSALFAGGRWFAPFEWTFQFRVHTAHEEHGIRLSLLEPLIALAAWIFAVSCWLPRGTLTLPAALLVLALIGGPTAMVLLNHPGLAVHNVEWDALTFWLPATGLIAAALSFLRGARHGRKPLRLAGWTAAGTLLAAAPVWGWTANRWHDYVALDLTSDSLALEPAALGEGGRFVFANVQPRVARYGGRVEDEAVRPVVVDVETCELHVAGSIDTRFDYPGGWLSLATMPLVLVTRERRAEIAYWDGLGRSVSSPLEFCDAFDGKSGARLSGEQWKSLLGAGRSVDDSIVRARDSLVMPDGSRCWMSGRTLHVESRDGTPTLQEFKEAPPERRRWQACGAGFQLGWCDGFVDVSARRFVSGTKVQAILKKFSDGDPYASPYSVVAIRSSGWLLRIVHGRRTRTSEYVLWSPGDATVRPVAGIAPGEIAVAATTDGRVLVAAWNSDRASSNTTKEIAFVDPATGARSPVVLPAGIPPPSGVALRERLPSGALVVYLFPADRHPARSHRVARISLDGVMQVAADVPGETREIGCPDDSSILLLSENRRILRAGFDGSPVELLFPRDEARR